MSKQYSLKKICATALVGFLVVVLAIYLIAGDAFHHKTTRSATVDAAFGTGLLVDGAEVEQTFTPETNCIVSVDLQFELYSRVNAGTVTMTIADDSGEELTEVTLNAAELAQGLNTITLPEPIEGEKGNLLTMTVTANGATEADAVSLYCGNSIQLGRGSVAQTYTDAEKVTVNGAKMEGALCINVTGRTTLWFGTYYWLIMAGVFALLCIYAAVLLKKEKAGKKSPALNFIASLRRYHFLIKQLVSRDFKTKYRRSVLGVLWSVLNPLLTMLVQYVVFSTLFKSSIAHYPAYLLSGIVLFNFFTEVTTVGLCSITDNAMLITKVYVPKYIYPLTRMLSSTVNMLFTFIPLILVTIFTGVWPAFSWLLLLFDLLCLMGFSLGISYLLATLMVYFRDTQFLWSVVSMVWMYCTPLFYPESIIPSSLLRFYHMNPMYQIVAFARTALIDGVSPSPASYLYCLLIGIVPLIIGLWVFNRKEKDFALYL
jgi:ABC-2 type transport system permease protein